ncbi:membrane dipeptidase [Actinocorallia sp. A-T 12471]|uniref:membrane dipeptidase n=1 Tax=Actinocorallia sp. A-T 12471 TaxID=3089813 RepID=UPI0029D2F676|nr:membrane dipeptidase [Actinocorallia sp. A-T 12471]MDX6741655.1 membrane dipeptidase [Actinocorallia sp. A-T 12471]
MPRDLHARAVVADAHNDLLMAVVARPPARWASFFRKQWLPQLRAGGVDIQVLPVFIDDAFRPEGALRETLRMIECAHTIAEGNADAVRLCLNDRQINAALADGRIALVLHVEHVVGVAGVGHVGLGPDFVHEVYTDLAPPCCEDRAGGVGFDVMATLPGLAGPAGLPLLTEELVARGMGEAEIRGVLGGNVRRVFGGFFG